MSTGIYRPGSSADRDTYKADQVRYRSSHEHWDDQSQNIRLFHTLRLELRDVSMV